MIIISYKVAVHEREKKSEFCPLSNTIREAAVYNDCMIVKTLSPPSHGFSLIGELIVECLRIVGSTGHHSLH